MSKNKKDIGLGLFDILAAKRAYREGRNVTSFLRKDLGVYINTPEIIEVAYDVQSGAYVKKMEANPVEGENYAAELARVVGRWMPENGSLMDVGTGELTIFSSLLNQLKVRLARVLAFDLSWSRVYSGLPYAREYMGESFPRFTPFVADMGLIPLPNKSVDVVISNHALEPNGGALRVLMQELFRVTRNTLVLFEPYYEAGTDVEKARMDQLGYIKGIENTVISLKGTILEMFKMNKVLNPLNPTYCFVVSPPNSVSAAEEKSDFYFTVPGTNYPLIPKNGYFFSNETGLCFPQLENIPVLKLRNAVLASVLSQVE